MTAFFKFKNAIANQLSSQTKCNSQELLTLMRPSKIRKEGHVSISLPKLNASLAVPLSKQNLNDWSKSLIDSFQPNEFIEEAKLHNSNFYFKFRETDFIKQVLQQVYKDNRTYGWSHIQKPAPGENSVIIDYSSPNIAKPFHAGHLRSTILGNFIRQIHEALGYNVVGINYLGDWGKQYGLLAVGFAKYGDEKQLVEDPIHHLYQVYVKINTEAKSNTDIDRQANEYFRRMEEGDPDALKQWKRFRDMSIKSFTSIYERLNIKFDTYSGESQVNPYIPEAYKLLENNRLLSKTDDEALAVDLEKYKLGKAIVKRADGTTLYVTRDLASVLMRKEKYNFQKAFYVVGHEQSRYFKQVFQIANLMTSSSLDLNHVDFGRIKGMSTRKGTVVFLQDILDTAKERILEYINNDEKKSQMENIESVADQLGISAILIQDLKSKRNKDYEFSWDRMTDAKGDTGVFLQYAHARACGIERKSGVEITSDCDFSLLKEKEAYELIQLIAQFPEVLDSTFKSLEPCTIVNYLFKLSHATSVASKFLRVKDMDPELSKSRMLLFWSARMTLGNGLNLLGIKPIEEM